MRTRYRIGIVGSGHMATHLGKMLRACGISPSFVHSRNTVQGRKLARSLRAPFLTSLPYCTESNLLLFVCTPDDTLTKLLQLYTRNGYSVVHCSGQTPLIFPKGRQQESAVFWPMLSFTKHTRVSWEKAVVCIESTQDTLRNFLQRLARKAGARPYVCTADQRRKLHLAAVFANNFSNLQYTIAAALLAEEGIPFDLMKSIIMEGAKKVQAIPPSQAQTGPASRGDMKALRSHYALLKAHPEELKIYKLLSATLLKKKYS